MDLQNLLDDIVGTVQPLLGQGAPANYIPSLAAVDTKQFGISVATANGDVFASGDADVPFSIQSISKVYALALVLAGDGDRIWKRVFREPSGNPFNSLVQLEHEDGIPRNPFINAGALVVTDRLLSIAGNSPSPVRELLRQESGNNSIDADPVVAASEAANSHRNASLAHFLASYGNLENPVDSVLEAYIAQCALEMSCTDLALASRFLANNGLRGNGTALLSPSQTKRINAVMLTCGTYDAAGEFAYRVGLPGKSGVGGGIVAVVPNKCTICVWSPGLGRSGNSLAGVAALDEFTTRTGWSIF
ncbi:glutaminase [Arthrobacter sp. FW306-2-2C-D06B]|jgi:glutaminase|uniref:glutaminase n=1 Tax=Arthrobacter sp. FW306-2-2C-D06B TaxID=2879618 RepID=UPI001F01A490|nr:glutaminase [Arthrobacter sp. FW306-2-2C-D06B]UKA58165.1 glutaminase [Arthrobacter sp. FW306-2-2C-D06B]